MPNVPLAIGAYQRASAFVPEVRCVNMYLEKDDSGVSPDGTLRIQRPGLVVREATGQAIRAIRYWPAKSQFLIVRGGSLYLGSTPIGTLPDGETSLTVTSLAAGIVVNGAAFVSDGATVTSVTIPDGRLVVDVDQLNGYIIFLTTTGRFYWLVPGVSALDPLDFATAESSGDAGRAVRRIGDEFFIFGSDSTEPWQATGDLDAPFSRAQGRLYQRGALESATVRQFDNALVWVGDDGSVYRLGSVPQVISSPGLDERIRKRFAGLSAWVFKYDGHEFYCLTIPGQGTFCYDASTQQWSEFTWTARVGETVDGVTLCGDAAGNLYDLAGVSSDAGIVFERIVTGTVGFFGAGPRNDSLSVGVGASDDATVRIRWQDGQDGYPAYYDEIDIRAPMDIATMYRLGQPDQPHRTFEVSCVDPAVIRIAGLVANESYQGGNG